MNGDYDKHLEHQRFMHEEYDPEEEARDLEEHQERELDRLMDEKQAEDYLKKSDKER